MSDTGERSSAMPDPIEALAAVLVRWGEALRGWESRLTGPRTIGPEIAIRSYRFLVQRQAETLGTHARAFRLADAADRLRSFDFGVRHDLRTVALRETGQSGRLAVALLSPPNRVYLRADVRGDGRVVEVLGDLVRARDVVILVPGMTNVLANYETELRTKAVDLLAELQRQSPRIPVAVVAWLGYDTPDLSVSGLVDARQSVKAREGAESLAADLVAIRRINSSARITAVGHSYGSVVLGQAMQRGLDRKGVASVVVVGSPGMDADSRRKLGSPAIDLWASKATLSTPVPFSLPFPFVGPVIPVLRRLTVDPIAFAPAHGEDPSAKGFGAHRFSSNGTTSHGAYFEPGSEALRNVAKIALAK